MARSFLAAFFPFFGGKKKESNQHPFFFISISFSPFPKNSPLVVRVLFLLWLEEAHADFSLLLTVIKRSLFFQVAT